MADAGQAPQAGEGLSVFHGDLPIAAKLERARTELLDLSARNRLLSIPRSATSARLIEVIDERSDEVFRLLVREGKRMSFAAGRASPSEAEAAERAESNAGLEQPDDSLDGRGNPSRHADTRLQTRLSSPGLQKRLLDLYHDARTLEEEQGVNILFLALGTLRWTDPANAELTRTAPLILVPVALERGTAAERFTLRWRSEDVSPNVSLQAYLDQVHGIALPMFEAGDEFEPAGYHAQVAAAVSAKAGWRVEADSIVLGFFSFSKFLMYRDLDPAVWPEDAKLCDQRIVRALLAEGFPPGEPLIDEDAPIDPCIPPEAMVHIVDCDASQALAVDAVGRGRDLVIQGPPGTGKSQTIANIIAAAVAAGKSVLFVAEKMAALEVVKRRLDGAGVGELCLELHSNKANKRLVLEELRRTWELGAPRSDIGGSLITRLRAVRDELNAHVTRLHTPDQPSGLTPYIVMGHLIRLRQNGQAPVAFQLDGAADWTADAFAARERLVRELVERIEDIGLADEHPWRGVALRAILPPDAERLVARLEAITNAFDDAVADQLRLAKMLDTGAPRSFAAFATVEALALRVASAPPLDGQALASPAWSGALGNIEALLRDGAEFSQLSKTLAGMPDVGRTADIVATQALLADLPEAFGADASARARSLDDLLPKLLHEADRLRRHMAVEGAFDTVQRLEWLARVGERVGEAPALDPDAFSAVVWEHGTEDAIELADAVAELQRRRSELAGKLGEEAWALDLSAARAAFARRGGSWLRFLSGAWRRANQQLKPLIVDGAADPGEIVRRLDLLAAGQAAASRIEAGDALGRAAFATAWRKDSSDPAPLAALADWMRSLGSLGPEPRLIAARLHDRAAAHERAARVHALLAEIRPLLAALQRDLGAAAEACLGDDVSVEATPLAAAAAWIARLVAADRLCAELLPGAPATAGARRQALAQLAQRQVLETALSAADAVGRSAFGSAWNGAASDWPQLAAAAAWIKDNMDIRAVAAQIADRHALPALAEAARLAGEAVASELHDVWQALSFDAAGQLGSADARAVARGALRARLDDWAGNDEALFQWVNYRGRATEACELGLAALVERIENGDLAFDEAAAAFEMAYYEAMLAKMARAEPALARFDGALHDRCVAEFRELDLERIQAARLEVVRAHHRGMPRVDGGAGPLGILRSEIARKRGHMPIRRLMERAGPAIQAIKPVFMMSPLSVAQFLTPGRMAFDLLVMDEASQIQPVDALGAIARARQVVVVGDERQLPPTRFFSKMTSGDGADDDEDGAQVGDVESVLGLFAARGLPQLMLRWHYRSKHQSLIAVSNSEFYHNKLNIVPSPYTGEAGMGLLFHHLPDGVFDAAGTGTNAREADAVAAAVMRHARAHPELSLGVAAFSVRQRRAIQDALERLRRLDPHAESFFHSHPTEPFFVKNLENVQGDERDVIFISVGYARTAQGAIAMRFGPLSAEGGERRLNVLISRAKRRCEVFSSITDEDIDVERGKGKGVAAFKLFLHFARTGRLSVAQPGRRRPNSVFEEQVAKALTQRGYQVHPQVGIAGLFIDLAVADPDRPGRYLIGIECDGASYRAARSARDRDRLRQAVLEDHGWTIHRLWSLDWFQRPKEQLARVVAAIEAAKAALDMPGERRALEPARVATAPIERADGSAAGPDAAGGRPAEPYREASFAVPSGAYELHEAPIEVLADIAKRVVAIEGPVHLFEVTARVRSMWGLQRAGGRVQGAVERAVQTLVASASVNDCAGFLLLPDAPVRVRDRSAVASPGLRQPAMLPPAEIDVAVRCIVEANLGARGDEIVVGVSRMLGFKATSAQLREAIEAVVDAMIKRSVLVPSGDHFRLNENPLLAEEAALA